LEPGAVGERLGWADLHAEFGGCQGVVPLAQGRGEQLVGFAHEAGDQVGVGDGGVVGILSRA
jgi:hypothetical protein